MLIEKQPLNIQTDSNCSNCTEFFNKLSKIPEI